MNTSDDKSNAYPQGQLFSGLKSNLTNSVKLTGSMAGGFLKFGASAIVSGADKVSRNISATAI